ncbi:sugar kinase [Granulosicoccus sp.]|nr:sugar kinase [Granulosicoccus sp.]MDB4222158.1 sugar kinase [Granulosicoccus sp.]
MNSTTPTLRIACFGEAMVELMLGDATSENAALGFAGDTLNCAIYLKRLLGSNAAVSFITKLGEDPLSIRTKKFIESESINTTRIESSATRSIGLYAIETDDKGERTFSYWRGQSAARTLFEAEEGNDFSALEGFDVLCFSAISLAILPANTRTALLKELSRLRAEHGVRVVFDSNYRPALWENVEVAREFVADAWRVTDIALPSIDDEQQLFGDPDEAAVIARLLSYGITQGALKRGDLGPKSLHLINGQLPSCSPQFPAATKIIDTTAAGDSFNAGYLSGLLSASENAAAPGSNTENTSETSVANNAAMQSGHACSLRVIANSGAIIPKDMW